MSCTICVSVSESSACAVPSQKVDHAILRGTAVGRARGREQGPHAAPRRVEKFIVVAHFANGFRMEARDASARSGEMDPCRQNICHSETSD